MKATIIYHGLAQAAYLAVVYLWVVFVKWDWALLDDLAAASSNDRGLILIFVAIGSAFVSLLVAGIRDDLPWV